MKISNICINSEFSKLKDYISVCPVVQRILRTKIELDTSRCCYFGYLILSVTAFEDLGGSIFEFLSLRELTRIRDKQGQTVHIQSERESERVLERNRKERNQAYCAMVLYNYFL